MNYTVQVVKNSIKVTFLTINYLEVDKTKIKINQISSLKIV